jgi:corrinoid protein of di/trimethylamine methyltransferase
MKDSVNRKEAVLERLSNCVIEGSLEDCEQAAKEALVLGINPYDAIMQGCARGMRVVGDKYVKNEIFIPEVLLSASAFYGATNILKSHLRTEPTKSLGTVVIGVCQGDIHDIGKNLVVMLLEAEGFTVYDLGVDVPPERFIEKSKEVNADIIAVSTLMTSTLFAIKKLIDLLKNAGLRSKFKVIVGGASTSEEFAKEVGADAWGKDACEGIKAMKRLLEDVRKA